MSIKLNEEQLFQLLDLYEVHECLWNMNNADYKNRVAREEAVIDILQNMNIPNMGILELKGKIKSLRSTYNQELTKVLKSLDAGNYVYKPQLIWFDRVDSFLRKTAEARKQASKIKNDVDSQDSKFSQDPVSIKREGAFEEVDCTLGDIFEGNETESEEDVQQVIQPAKKQKRIYSVLPLPMKTQTIEAKRQRSDRESIELVENALIDFSNRITRNQKRDDCEFEVFGRYVAAQLKKLPLVNALKLQGDIQSSILAERLRVENEKCDTTLL